MIGYEVIARMTDMNYPEQEAKCAEYGIDLNPWSKEIQIHFFDSDFHNESTYLSTVHDAVDALAVKESADLVRFCNGNLGFVATYGEIKNGFEIIGKAR